MKALNKQALREAANAANIASWGKWESYKPHKGARGYEVKVGAKAVAQHCLKVDSAFGIHRRRQPAHRTGAAG